MDLLTPARAAMASMVTASILPLTRRSVAAARIATRARSLRGRPGRDVPRRHPSSEPSALGTTFVATYSVGEHVGLISVRPSARPLTTAP